MVVTEPSSEAATPEPGVPESGVSESGVSKPAASTVLDAELDRDLVELEELEREAAVLQRELDAPLIGEDGFTEPLFSDFSES